MEPKGTSDWPARRGRIALLGAVPALLVGLLVAFDVSAGGTANRSGQTVSASARVLVQARNAPPVDLDPTATDSAAARARLIGDLMASDPVHRDVARRARIEPRQLSVLTPTSGTIETPVPIAIEAAAAARPRTPYVLVVRADGQIPIITLEVAASSPGVARRIVRAAESGLVRLGSDGSSQGERPVLLRLGAPSISVIGARSKLPFGVAATLLTFGLWSAAVVVGTGLVSRWRPRPPGGPSRARASSRKRRSGRGVVR